jgi:uncharacterized protein (TIGR03032 family)
MSKMDQPMANQPLAAECSRDFAAWLAEQQVGLAFTTAAGGQLGMIGLAEDDSVSVFTRAFDGAYGLHASGHSLLLGTAYQIWRLENAVTPGDEASGYDRLYVPRVGLTTGEVRAADVAFAADGTVLFANTLFSCIALAGPEFSFTPIWRPDFISRLAPENRCHLTGFALDEGRVRYVAVAARSDEAHGWKPRIGDGGLVIDAATDEVVARGLALPCAPRLAGDRLWLNEAASGLFGLVHADSNTIEEIAFCPGWLSGLDLAGDFAVVATSRQRNGMSLLGLPLDENLAADGVKPQTALCVVDLNRGEIAHWIRFDDVAEIGDVAVLAGAARPAVLGLAGKDIRRVLSIGPDRSQRGAAASVAAE